jgi:N-acetylmuramoyl-L-alanine amidase
MFDTKIILTEDFADDCAEALTNALVKIGGLKEKTPAKVETKPSTEDRIYRVQVGAYSVKANADALAKKLIADGYDAIVV